MIIIKHTKRRIKMGEPDVFTFGKHQGKTAWWVWCCDKQYILWLIKEKIVLFDAEMNKHICEYKLAKFHGETEWDNNCGSGGMDYDWAAEVGADDGIWVWG